MRIQFACGTIVVLSLLHALFLVQVALVPDLFLLERGVVGFLMGIVVGFSQPRLELSHHNHLLAFFFAFALFEQETFRHLEVRLQLRLLVRSSLLVRKSKLMASLH